MDKLFQSKWFIRIISLLFAIILYLFVAVETNVNQDDSRIPIGSTDDIQVLEEVPLGIKIDADQYVVSGVPEHVTVTLEGRTSILTPIARQLNFNVFVDLRELSEGEHTVEVEYENLPENVTAYIEPKTIQVTIERRTTKEFPVQVEIINEDQLPAGYEIGTPEVNPETVTLVSSQEVIEQVALVKVFLDVAELREPIRNRELPVSVYDAQGNDLKVRIEPESVTVSLSVERPSKKVPLSVETKGTLPEDLEIESIVATEEIEIFGKRAVLDKVKQVKTKPLDLSKVTKSDTYKLDLELPEGTIASNDFVEVKININKKKEFDNISIDSEADEALEYSFVNPEDGKLSVQAFGSDQEINRLKKTDIKAIVTLGDLTEGEHELHVDIEGPEGVLLEPNIDSVTVKVQ